MLKVFILLFLSLVTLVMVPAQGLTLVSPSQIAVLANENSLESLALADYYMTQRHIPKHHRIDLDVSLDETIGRSEYNERLLLPLQKKLRKRGLESQIRVLVTVWGIPLRVRQPQPDPQESDWIEDALQWKHSAISLLEEKQEKLKRRFPQASTDRPAKATTQTEKTASSMNAQKIKKWKNKFQEIFEALLKLPSNDPVVGAQEELRQALSREHQQIFGQASRLNGLRSQEGRNNPNKKHVLGMVQALLRKPTATNRSNAYALIQEQFGLFGVLSFADWEMQQYRYSEGLASVDSELSFLWWKPGTYPLSGRIPNPHYLGYSITPEAWPLPILMVSRIDAPRVLQAQRMIDHALATEKTGLRGKAYIDARGVKQTGRPGSSGHYDMNMQSFARMLKKASPYPVVWENTEKRFSQPGQAPNVALYVGWYRLRHYEDAFTFNPGSLGYHVASGEAASVHNPRERGWCKNALERGITVTLGPVGEPYLDAFPLPKELYGLLFSGEFSLVEAFFLSKRYVSWKMVLFGDPLYNPWHQKSSELNTLAKEMLKGSSWPTPPGTSPWPPPDLQIDEARLPGKYRSLEMAVFR